jgi:proton-translocating NADH-quinone oxidoreductase chain L
MIWVIATLAPLAAFVVEILFGRRLGKRAAYVATGAIGFSCLLSTIGLGAYLLNHSSALHAPAAEHAPRGTVPHSSPSDKSQNVGAPNPADQAQAATHDPVFDNASYVWATLSAKLVGGAKSGPWAVRLGYLVDNVTVLMFFMVTLVATCIHVYSIGYMSHEPRFHRFFAFLSLFCFSMLNLVLADNFFQVFISWELVGICSYLLIGFYYEKRSASDAANKAFITNRIGDVGFIVGLMVLFANFGTFDFLEIFGAIRDEHGALKSALPISHFWLTVAGLGVFVGCVGKSAQFPLHVWLPDAMEGPTPVSALIHAATMVAAGVYLVARVFPLFTPEVLLIITYVGGITLFVAATIAIVATDIKRVLAYSTVSQLGYMMLALGLGGWVAGLMHLITHAFFKALLFLCSGSVIHGTGTQEMPQMGGLHRKMPITSWTMLVGVLAICGCPFFSGFYSKDAIVAQVLAYGQANPWHVVVLVLPVVTAGITAFYMFRLWFMTFAGEPRDPHVFDHAHESPPVMWIPLVILAVGAVLAAGLPGWPALEHFIAYGAPSALETGTMAAIGHSAHEMHGWATLIASMAAAAGVAMAILVYWMRELSPQDAIRQFPRTYNLLVHKWYFDELYRYMVVRPALVVAAVCRWIDNTIIDRLVDGSATATVRLSRLDGRFDLGIVDGAVNLLARIVYGGGTSLHGVQTGWLRGYVMSIALGAVAVFALGAYLF